jgi:hypothetical protein
MEKELMMIEVELLSSVVMNQAAKKKYVSDR